MGWNGSDLRNTNKGELAPKTPAKRKAGGSPWVKLALGVFAIVAVLLMAYFIVSPSTETAKPTDKASRRISEANPKVRVPRQTSTIEAEVKKPAAAPRPTPPQAVTNDLGNGMKSVIVNGKETIVVAPPSGPALGIDKFEFRSERQLAFLACLPVGTLVLGDEDYHTEEFKKDMEKALVNKIEILPDDDEETRYYKQSVIDVKKQLVQMLKKGEDIFDALTETRKELQQLGIYKMELEGEINKLREDDGKMTDDEVESLVEAANKMLEAKGIEKFHFNKLTQEIIKTKPFATRAELEAEAARREEENAEILQEREAAKQNAEAETD